MVTMEKLIEDDADILGHPATNDGQKVFFPQLLPNRIGYDAIQSLPVTEVFYTVAYEQPSYSNSNIDFLVLSR